MNSGIGLCDRMVIAVVAFTWLYEGQHTVTLNVLCTLSTFLLTSAEIKFWGLRVDCSQNGRCTHPQLNHCPDNAKRACHRRACYKMEWIYTRTKVSGHGSLELAQENRKKEERKKD